VTEETMSKLRIAPRGAPPQPDPPKAAALPDAARHKLENLAVEVQGAAMVLRAEVVVVEEEDMYFAVSMWLDRIAADLGEMECRQYPIAASEAK
jgi:hypothetical protein